MDTFFEELQKARLLRGITIAEIEEKTRISGHFLTALEEGNTSVLPQPYVRAFLREYAEAIGLDANETLKRFAEATGTAPPPPPLPAMGEPSQPSPETSQEQRSSEPLGVRPATKIALGAAAFLVLLIAVWLLIPWGDRDAVKEISFERAVKEAEGRAPAQSSTPGETRALSSPAVSDSLTLVVQTSERVWVELSIDNQKPQNIMLSTNDRATWKARDRFTVTVGNAGGIRFKLDSKELQPIGKPGQVVRNVTISRSGVVIP